MSGKKKDNKVYDAGFVGEEPVKTAKSARPVRPRTGSAKQPPRPVRTNNATQPKRANVQTNAGGIDTLPGNTVRGSRPVPVKTSASAQNKRPAPKKPSTAQKKVAKKRPTAKKKPAPRKGENINKTIRVQSPAARKAVRQSKKLTGSAKNLEVNRRAHRQKSTFRIKKKNNSFKTVLARLVVFLVVFVLFTGIFAALFAVSLKSDTDNAKTTVKINVGGENDPEFYSYNSSYCLIDSRYYICADDLMNLYSLTVTGTKDHLHYIVSESGEYVSFDVGTRNATVNGSPVKLDGECFMKGGRLYVPASFFTGYSKGFDYNTDDGEVSIERIESVKAANGDPVYDELSFVLKPVSVPAVMDEEDAKGDAKFIDKDDGDGEDGDDDEDNNDDDE